ncbi:MAG: ABC transporter ATP-binding protein, partial [Thermodesulfobacteriota bacterium]
MLLRIEGLEAGYGEIQVLWDIHLKIDRGETVSLLGSNGAGKSTLIWTITGLLKPQRGEIYFEDIALSPLSTDRIVKKGICQIPEGRRLFAGLSVRENLMMGAFSRGDKEETNRDLDWIFDLFPALAERKSQLGGTLSGGEQQMCAIGRGLMSRPQLLLIDELSLGLAPVIVDELVKTLEVIKKRGTTIFLVEQDVHLALEHTQRGYVLETGR